MAADMKVATKHANQNTIGTEFMYAYVLAIMAMSKESLSIKAFVFIRAISAAYNSFGQK